MSTNKEVAVSSVSLYAPCQTFPLEKKEENRIQNFMKKGKKKTSRVPLKKKRKKKKEVLSSRPENVPLRRWIRFETELLCCCS